jgi:hypothetical protein
LAFADLRVGPTRQIETVNRLLKAQSTRTRAKAPAEAPSSHLTSRSSPSKASRRADEEADGPPRFYRTIQSIRTGSFVSTLSAPTDERYVDALQEVGRTIVPAKRQRMEAV